MADASEAQQLVAVEAALQQRDVASLARLTRDATSAAVSEAGCGALAGVLADDDCSPTLEETQYAVKALVSALRAQPTCAAVQQEGYLGLEDWCADSDEARDVAGAGGAVEAVLAGMRAHANAADVMEAACAALGKLMESHSQNSDRAHDAGALDVLLDIMRAHPTHEVVLNNACIALGNTCQNVAAAPAAAVKLSAPALIMNTLQSFPDNSALQAHACFALAATLSSEPTNGDSPHIDAVSYVTGVLRALRQHAADERVLLHACMAILNLLGCKPVHIDAAKAAWRQDAFRLLVNTLKLHKMNPDICERCCAAARNLMLCARGPGTTFRSSEAEAAMHFTLAALRAHPTHPAMQRSGCSFLSGLLSEARQLVFVGAEAGVMEAVVHVVRAFLTSDVDVCAAACTSLGNLASDASSLRHRANAAGAVTAVVAVLKTYPGNASAQEDAAYALHWLCTNDPAAYAQAVRCGAVKPLCDAICTHAGELRTLQYALEALNGLVAEDETAAAEVAAAGPAGIGAVAQVLLSSTSLQGDEILMHACEIWARIVPRDATAMSTADAVLPLLHVLTECSLANPDTARAVFESLLFVTMFSAAHAAEAAKCGAVAAVDAAARAHPRDSVVQHWAAEIRTLLARVKAEAVAAAAAATAHEEAERRAAAMADALIAEEEAARVARAAPQAAAARKRSKNKRGGGGGAAGAEGAAAADDDAARALEPERSAAGAAAALSALALGNAAPSAAAARRRKRAAVKAARKLAQRADAVPGSSEAAAAGNADTEKNEADEADAAEAAAQPAAPPPSPPPPDAAAASAPLPPPPPPLLMKECCVCLLDMPAAEQMVLAPCGHRCMCEACWRERLLPREPAARLCPICDAPVAMAMQMFGRDTHLSGRVTPQRQGPL